MTPEMNTRAFKKQDVNTAVVQMDNWSTKEVTELRYAVEVEIPRSTRMVGLLEPLLEQVVYEDIPTNLRAIKLHVEQVKAQGKSLLIHERYL